jgi:hypothetical protein
VDFQPDAPATKDWRDEVLKRCIGYDFNLLVGRQSSRVASSPQVWQKLEKVPCKPLDSPKAQ